jgi:tetratricopeptide (TPR) repeat protein
MEENQTTWQQALERGNASEALQLHLDNAEANDSVKTSLENLVAMQDLLREKNPAKARGSLKSNDQTLEWLRQLFQELDAELPILEQAIKTLDKHDVDKTLELLAGIKQPLLQAEVETLRGTAMIYYNKTVEAKEAFEKAISLDPKHYRAITNLGNLALESNNLDEAISKYEGALKLNENFANAHHNLAVAYRKKGMVSKSVSELKKAQRVSQQKLREEARQMFKGAQSRKYLRWLLYAAIAIVAYLFFRQRIP